jgi:hypothetical protein
MGAAEEATADFHPVADDSTTAVLTNRRDGLNCALEAVEGVPRAGGDQLKSLIVLISANFAFRHVAPLSSRGSSLAQVLPRFALFPSQGILRRQPTTFIRAFAVNAHAQS